MKISIHQPHYFPWIGYFNKIAQSDLFVLLDEVQLEKGSQMIRNKVIDNNGDIKYITISANTKGYLSKKYSEITTKDNEIWQRRQLEAIKNYYRNSSHIEEIYPIIEDFFKNNYNSLFEWTRSSIVLINSILDIRVPIIYQSKINYDKNCRKSDLVHSICTALHADTYLSGRGGSVNYLDRESFKNAGVNIEFQNFQHPLYPQVNTREFIGGVSILDVLLNCGVSKTKEIFWDNLNKGG